MPSAHRALGLALVLFAATACGGGGESARPQAAPTGAATATPDGLERAPDFTLEKLDGGTFTLSEHLGELPVVLNFWAPW